MKNSKRRNTTQARTPPKHKVGGYRKGPVLNTGYSNGGASLTHQAMQNYLPIKSSPKADIDANLSILRNRSADMAINSPLGASAITTSRAHIVGAGLTLSPKIAFQILGLTPMEAIEWQRKTKAEFSLWADSVECDLYRKHNFYDLQDVAFISFLMDGDGWAMVKNRPAMGDNPYTTRVQLFEASRVCNPGSLNISGNTSALDLQTTNKENGNRIINGVEINQDGAVVAYWVANRVPYDPYESKKVEWHRVEAFGKRTGVPNVLQISHEERPEQYRGVPFLAPVLEELKQISRYSTAELTAAVIKSYFSLFFTSEENADGLDSVLPEAFDETQREKANLSDYQFLLGPGTMNELPPGYKVQTIDANRNLSMFDSFTSALISRVGAALGIPAEVMLSSFKTSYSAARGALLQFSSVAKMRRTWFARDFCQPVYEQWLAEAVAIGRIEAPGFFDDPLIRKAWCKANWYGPVMGQLDPVKEAQAKKMLVDYGFSTGEQAAAEISGSEYEDNISTLAIEREYWKNNNIAYPTTVTVETKEGGETNAQD